MSEFYEDNRTAIKKPYRPEGWETLKPSYKTLHCLYPDECVSHAYEAGADAMLKRLRKEGTHFKAGRWTDDATFETDVPGWVVFIPDKVK
ncbi:hypothetical protein LCGC14_0827040 [marine sediment metagenome]|uniref:Uncharacterized protein n=1 Tax=marine sediment metagenome TaxID=412755 RepID=A0A0F9PH11_9ZZZZ